MMEKDISIDMTISEAWDWIKLLYGLYNQNFVPIE